MRERITLEGRSLLFNSMFVLLNLIGMSFMVMGYHESFAEQSTMFLTIALILLILSIGGLIIMKGRMLMSSVARVIIGGLFIVSGLVKANDPMGFAYKLEEYFEDGALAYRIKEWFSSPGFSMEFFVDYALFLSILICIAEIVLGVLTIIGGKIKLVSYLLLLMMLFFTFLTWHTANCDPESKFTDRDTYAATDPIAQIKIDEAKTNENITIVSSNKEEVVVDELKQPQCVKDCGCFGDALKGSVGRSLTPSESLWKDIVLLYLVLWVFIAQWQIKPNTRRENMVFVPTSILVIIFFCWVFGWYFPFWFGLLAILSSLWLLNLKHKYLSNHWMVALLVTFWCIVLEIYVLMYVPLKDYRPYAVGSNLIENMNNGVKGESAFYYTITNLETGESKYLPMGEIDPEVWSNTKKWKSEYEGEVVVVEPVNPSIMDFNPVIYMEDISDAERNVSFVKAMLDTSVTQVLLIHSIEYNSDMETPIEEYMPEMFPAEEYTILDTIYKINPALTDLQIKDAMLAEDKLVMMVSRRLSEANLNEIDRIKEVFNACQKKGVPFIFVCNSSREEINAFRKDHDFEVPTFIMDEIELKIISRSNPALLVIENAVVTEKYSHRTIPNGKSFAEKHLK